MDLSHWDLIDTFSLGEAAILASGYDPNMVGDPHQRAKSKLMRRLMEEAHDLAIKHADYYLRSQFDEDFFFVEKPVESGDLQSIELQKKFHICLSLERPLGAFEIEEPTFSRERLGVWLEEKGYQSPYSFITQPSQAQSHEEKPLTAKERISLLIVIALLAEEARIDISKPSKAAATILKLAETQGINIAQRTIEEHLKKIPDALQRRGKPEA